MIENTALREILARELEKTSLRDADDVRRGTETWRLTVAIDAMKIAYKAGRESVPTNEVAF